jgi:hypothetical protein
MLGLNLRLAGAVILVLVAAYPIYPKWFGWRQELERVSLLTRQVFFVHCGFIVLLLALQAVLLLKFPQAVMEKSSAAQALLLGMTAFWIYRLIAQLLIYSPRLWTGNRLHTVVHVVFTALWAYLTAVCAWGLWYQFSA